MSIDWTARALAAFSVVIALCSFGWAVLSWRLSGPSLRVHCVVDDHNLTIRIFNRGRSGDTVEHVILGGTRRGFGGHDLSRALSLPVSIPPGEARTWRIRLSTLPDSRHRRLRSGWDVARLLCGSMRVLRTEVIPMENQSQVSAWLLVPRRARYARYLPSAGAFCAWSCFFGGRLAEIGFLALALGVVTMLIGLFMSGGRITNRALWVMTAWLTMSVAGAWGLQTESDGADLSFAANVVLITTGAIALAFAVPGLLAETVSLWNPHEWRMHIRRARARRRVALQSSRERVGQPTRDAP